MSVQTINLGLVRAIHVSGVAPTNPKILWYDTVVNKHKYYNLVAQQWMLLAADVVDALTSTSATTALSSNQGRILEGLISDLQESSNTAITNLTNLINNTTFSDGTGLNLTGTFGGDISYSVDTAYLTSFFDSLFQLKNTDDLDEGIVNLYYTPERVNALIDLQKGVANGLVPLNSSNLIPAQFLPAYIDEVFEFADLASFPNPGASSAIYIAIDTNFQYRWSGTTYVQITGGAVISVNTQTGIVNLTTGDIPEGSKLYYTDARVKAFGDVNYSLINHVHSYNDLTDLPILYTQAESNINFIQNQLATEQSANFHIDGRGIIKHYAVGPDSSALSLLSIPAAASNSLTRSLNLIGSLNNYTAGNTYIGGESSVISSSNTKPSIVTHLKTKNTISGAGTINKLSNIEIGGVSANGFSITDFFGILFEGLSVVSGGVIARAYNLYMPGINAATNGAALYIGNQHVTGIWDIYSEGTGRNYLKNQVNIGAISPNTNDILYVSGTARFLNDVFFNNAGVISSTTNLSIKSLAGKSLILGITGLSDSIVINSITGLPTFKKPVSTTNLSAIFEAPVKGIAATLADEFVTLAQLTSAIDQLDNEISNTIGNITSLATTNKNSLVEAINEINTTGANSNRFREILMVNEADEVIATVKTSADRHLQFISDDGSIMEDMGEDDEDEIVIVDPEGEPEVDLAPVPVIKYNMINGTDTINADGFAEFTLEASESFDPNGSPVTVEWIYNDVVDDGFEGFTEAPDRFVFNFINYSAIDIVSVLVKLDGPQAAQTYYINDQFLLSVNFVSTILTFLQGNYKVVVLNSLGAQVSEYNYSTSGGQFTLLSNDNYTIKIENII